MSVRILTGNALDVLRTLPEASVHCGVTSPPYWGLRDYGCPPVVWGGNPACAHEWGDEITRHRGGPHGNGVMLEGGRSVIDAQAATKEVRSGAFCQRCDAWRGQLGLEPTPALFVKHLMSIFRELRRVLRDDGTLWLNLGDCYATGAYAVGSSPGGGEQGERWTRRVLRTKDHAGKHTGIVAMGPMTQPNRLPLPGLKPKDLVGIPWRVAFALQEDGWWLRSAITWCKTAPMPESVRDRPTSATEMIFLLTKSDRYFYDQDAERVLYAPDSIPRTRRGRSESHKYADGGPGGQTLPADMAAGTSHPTGRNLWNYWLINPEPCPAAHFAVMPSEIARRCISLGTSSGGCCASCGAPRLRVVERRRQTDGRDELGARERNRGDRDDGFTKAPSGLLIESHTTGWQPGCSCEGGGIARPVVIDPFSGRGTTALVADQLGRDAIGIDLKPEYAELSRRTVRESAPLFHRETEAEAC